jgi:hypothetical protein
MSFMIDTDTSSAPLDRQASRAPRAQSAFFRSEAPVELGRCNDDATNAGSVGQPEERLVREKKKDR